MNIALSSDIHQDIRQTSLYILKAYIDSNWNLGCEKYSQGPVASQIVLAQYYTLSSPLLFLSFFRVNNSLEKIFFAFFPIAAPNYAKLLTIGRYDWPDEWPHMFQLLLNLIKNGIPEQVTSAMLVFKEIITRDLSSDQLHELGTIAIQIFAESVELLSILEFETIDKRVEGVKSMLSSWVQKLLEILSSKITIENVNNLVLKYSAVKALKNISISFSKHFDPYFDQTMSAIWVELQNFLQEYKIQYLNKLESNSNPQIWVSDLLLDDSTPVDLSNYISMLLEYTSVNTRHRLAKTIFTRLPQNSSNADSNILVNMISITIEYAQITRESAELWSSDIEQLVNDEEEYNSIYSVRQAAKEFAQTISEYFAEEYTNALSSAIQTAINKNSECISSKGLIYESTLYILETTSGIVTNVLSNDMNLTIQNIQTPVEVFSFGRAFLVTAIYSNLIPKDSLTELIQASIDISKVAATNNNLQELFSHQVVQAFSLMACSKFITTAPIDVVKPFFTDIVLKATSSVNHLGYEALFISLECILHVLKSEESLKEHLESTVSPLLVAAWLEFGKDPVLESLIVDLIAEMSKNQSCFISLFQRFVPAIKEIFSQVDNDKLSSAIEILSAIMQGGGRAEIPQECIFSIYPQLMDILLSSDDGNIAQSGQECVKYMIQNGLRHIVDYRNEQLNVSGLQLLFKYVENNLSLENETTSILGKPMKFSRFNNDEDSDDSWAEENFDGADLQEMPGKTQEEYGYYDNFNDLMKYGKDSETDEEEDNDIDILNSPVYNININSQIKQLVKKCVEMDSCFTDTIKPFLTTPEQKIMDSLASS
ncbi:hypothetical protein BB561_001627 [Smittium simulii]|uniref:Importin-9 central HEAT repeats domain-containing protein n=1 Tax=Smittium simulii TaxID=133385 RepID=A0A2T9YTR0_9FUNG|nr:hypothetical protein BB561_001627 [Smittium simulii]